VDAVEFQVEQLTDAQPAGALQQQCVGGQPVGRFGQLLGQAAVGVDGQIPRQGSGQPR